MEPERESDGDGCRYRSDGVSSSMSSEQWDRRYAGSELLWTAQPNRFLVAEVAELPPGRALDLACGEGRNAVWLAGQGWQVTGVDFSAVALEKARQLAAGRRVEVEWVKADLLDYRPERRGYELVVVFYLQLPAAQRTPILGAAADAAAIGGTLLVVAHDSRNLQCGHGGPQDAAVLYTAADVVADIDGSGLAIERAELVERTVETPDGELTALDALVRARRG
jgi:SAM-dependent methyltransferase